MVSLRWKDNCLFLLNQVKLPGAVEYIQCKDYRRVAEAIRRLEVRGAPAIGVAAAYGLLLGAAEIKETGTGFLEKLAEIAEILRQTRPTAVNLSWALDKMLTAAKEKYREKDPHPQEILTVLEMTAQFIMNEDSNVNRKISVFGASLFKDAKTGILTHCNAGALATVEHGTALGIIRQLWKEGRLEKVFADETRPLLQGARLTAWELMQDEIPVTLITDSMAGVVMKNGWVQAVVVGADRIARNGDVANKIGTYTVAVLAEKHHIPFYVAAPVSSFDFSLSDGSAIPIEERSANEVTHCCSVPIAPQGVAVYNPAFDVTPNELITAIVTEYGILRAPYNKSIDWLQSQKGGK
ncbi:MAG: S-methyl-5-thioribose-1-phosphate isomerase [Negativicutes bacterium]